MRKNVASQVVSARLIALADGTAVTTGTTTVYVTLSGGTQATGSGTVTHEGNGEWSYVPTQAETNSNQVSFMFTNSLSVGALVNVYPVAFDPTDSVRAGLTALPNAAAGADGGLIRLGANVFTSGNFSISGNSGSAVVFDAGTSGVTLSEVTFGGGIVMVDGAASDIPFDGDELTLLKTTITRGATVLPTSGTVSTLTQADIRTATGLASANLDTQLGEIATNAASAATDAGNASTNTTTLTSRLTATRAGYLDNLPNIDTAATRFLTMIVLDGSVYQFTANALELGPAGEGGGGTTVLYVSPLQTSVITPTYTVNGATEWPLEVAQNSTPSIVFVVADQNGNPVDLTGKTVRLVVHDAAKPFTTLGKLQTGGSGITIGGNDDNQITATFTSALTANAYAGAYKLWNDTDKQLLGSGSYVVFPAPINHT